MGIERWEPHVRKVADALYAEFPEITSFYTYPNHGATEDGRDGEPYGIDVQVAPWGVYATGSQYDLADRILTRVFEEWYDWKITYAIFADSITDEPVQSSWRYYDWTGYGRGGANVISQRHGDHVHLQVSIYPPVEEVISPKHVKIKPTFAVVGEPDMQAASAAAEVCVGHGFEDCTVTSGVKGVRAFDEWFHDQPVGSPAGQLIVVGKPAFGALLPKSRQYVSDGEWKSGSDYIGAVGRSYKDTLKKLETIMERYIAKGAGAEFRSVLATKAGEDVRPEKKPEQLKPAPNGARRGKKAVGKKEKKKAETDMELFTVAQLAAISQNPDPVEYDLAGDVAALVPAMKEGGITTKKRIAAFLGNICQETDHLNTLEEYGGYDYWLYLDRHPDGGPGEWRYHGRGYIQLTWSSNYKTAGDAIGVDLLNNPDLVKDDKDIAAKVAVWFWNSKGCSEYADRDEFYKVCALINTGSENGTPNHYTERHGFYQRALSFLPETPSDAGTPDALGHDGHLAHNPNLVAAGSEYAEAAHCMAAALWAADIPCTVTESAQGIRAFDAAFSKEALGGPRQMWVVGRPAFEALPETSRQFVRTPPVPEKSDYWGAVGETYEDTLNNLASLGDMIEEGLGDNFRARLAAQPGVSTSASPTQTKPSGATQHQGYTPTTSEMPQRVREPEGQGSPSTMESAAPYVDEERGYETPAETSSTEMPEGMESQQKPRRAVKELGPGRQPVMYSQIAALLVDAVVVFGLLPAGMDQGSLTQVVAAGLTMLGAHVGFGAAARQSVKPLAKE